MGLVKPETKVLFSTQLPVSIIKPKIDTIIAIVTQEAIDNFTPNMICLDLASTLTFDFFQER